MSQRIEIDIVSKGLTFRQIGPLANRWKTSDSAVAYAGSLRIPAVFFKRGMVEEEHVHNYTFRLIGQRLEHTTRLNALGRKGKIEFVNRRILVKRPASLVRGFSWQREEVSLPLP